jgi:phosphatidylglycerol---prolipoprotein diacylglyceryl transferase
MQPILFVIPGWDFKVHSYGVMILFACSAALAIGVWRARKEGINTDVVYELATWLFLGGIVGARGVYVLSHLDTFHSLRDVLQSWKGGNNFFGCILGGLTGSTLYWFRRPFKFWLMTDVAAPAVAIGIAIGRIGCYLNGCCYGAVCHLPWAVCFPAGSHAWVRQVDAGLIRPWAVQSLPVHPTQIYGSLAGFALLGLLLAYFPYRRAAGQAMAVLMIAYPLTRWPLEAVRGDEPPIFAGMTLSQNISVAVFVCGLALWFGLRGGLRVSGVVKRPSPPARSPVRFRLLGRRWVWHWHQDEGEEPVNKGKKASGRIDSEGAGQNRST